MTSVPLGRGAYERLYSGAPEVKLLNRWLEQNPANLREGTSILGRPGTTNLTYLDPGAFSASTSGFGPMRGNYYLSGLLNDALFVVCGQNLYMIGTDMSVTPIEGIINGTGYPEVAWQAGAGYQRLWIADGTLLQYYAGPTPATGTLTLTGAISNGVDAFEIGGVYYTWGTTFASTDAGTAAHPFVVKPTNTLGNSDPMNQLVLAIMNSGTAGADYSSTISGANTVVTATSSGVYPPAATSVTFSSIVHSSKGNLVTLSVTGGTALSVSGATLANGGINALQGCTMPNGYTPITLSQVSSYVLVGVSNSQVFYWVNPGETAIDPLNFASKESSPDNISMIRAVGDAVMIIGEKSTENWYATGNYSAPFAPIEGRVYARGAIDGTAVVIDQNVYLVGDDGRVYSIGTQPGDSSDAGWGVQRISNNGIEERIRYQVRREAGLKP